MFLPVSSKSNFSATRGLISFFRSTVSTSRGLSKEGRFELWFFDRSIKTQYVRKLLKVVLLVIYTDNRTHFFLYLKAPPFLKNPNLKMLRSYRIKDWNFVSFTLHKNSKSPKALLKVVLLEGCTDVRTHFSP